MTTTIKELMHALATLLGANSYNDYLESRQPVPVPIKPTQPLRTDSMIYRRSG